MTVSMVVAEPASGLLGVAGASRSLAVGSAVPAVWPGVGAAVSQAWTNPALRGLVLAALASGASPDRALEGIPAADPDHALRQVALVSVSGAAAVHTGAGCTAWAGSAALDGPLAGAVCGNLLAGPAVIEAVRRSLAGAVAGGDPLELAALMLAALDAAQAAGGDARGEQSAALVVGAGPAQPWPPYSLAVDLRVDDHPRPLAELRRLLALRPPAA